MSKNEYSEDLLQEYIKYFGQIIDVKITNKIKEQVDIFQQKTGTNKNSIARRLGMSKQALSETFKSTNPRIETLIRISICLGCKVEDLYDYESAVHINNNSEKTEK